MWIISMDTARSASDNDLEAVLSAGYGSEDVIQNTLPKPHITWILKKACSNLFHVFHVLDFTHDI